MAILVRNCDEKFKKLLDSLVFIKYKTQYDIKYKSDVTIEDVLMSDLYITFTTDEYDSIHKNKITILNSFDRISCNFGEIFVLDYRSILVEPEQKDSKVNILSELNNTKSDISIDFENLLSKYSPLNQLVTIIIEIIEYELPTYIQDRSRERKLQEIEYNTTKYEVNSVINNSDIHKAIKIFEKMHATKDKLQTKEMLDLYSTLKNTLIFRLNTSLLICSADTIKYNELPIIDFKKDAIVSANKKIKSAAIAFNKFIEDIKEDTVKIYEIFSATVESNYENAIQSLYNSKFYSISSAVQDIEITYDFELVFKPTNLSDRLKKIYKSACIQVTEMFKQDYHCIEYSMYGLPKTIIITRETLMNYLTTSTKEYHNKIKRAPGERVTFRPNLDYSVKLDSLIELFILRCEFINSRERELAAEKINTNFVNIIIRNVLSDNK